MENKQPTIQQQLLELELEVLKNRMEAQKIALKRLDSAIQSGDSATVAAMEELFKV